jgi:predicted flap endonuclease-1-like 5' DNA nuclease
MQWLLLQTFAWMTGVGLIGAVLGCMAHRIFAGRAADHGIVPTVSGAAAAGAMVAKRETLATKPAATVTTSSVPVVEASKAPAPVTARPAVGSVPAVAASGSTQPYTYPITTIGIPRANPELIQPQIQKITLPTSPVSATAPSVAPAASVQPAVVTKPMAPTAPVPPASAAMPVAPVAVAPIAAAPVATAVAPATVTIRQTPAAVAPVASQASSTVVAEPSQPRPEPLRPELARSPVVPSAPVASTTAKAPVAPGAPPPVSVAATGAAAPLRTIPSSPVPPSPVSTTPTAPVAPVATVSPQAPATSEAYAPITAGGAALAALAARAAAATAAPAPAQPASGSIAPTSTSLSSGDDLMRIRSVGADVQDRLKSAGVTRFSEIARWSQADVGRIGKLLGLSGRIEQENWIEQAQILATGGETEYSRRRSRGDVATPAAGSVPLVNAPAAPTAPAVPSTPAKPATAMNAATAVPAANTIPTAPVPPVVAAAPVVAPTMQASMAAGAAATAAAAAMATAAVSRATANIEPSMPAKLVDAIRENLVKPTVPAVPAVSPAATTSAEAPRVSRPDLAGLRSVRSEALRDTSAPELLRTGGSTRAGGALEDLKRVRGIGVLIEKKLNSLGVVSYEQIANWTNADIDRVSQILDFKGRIERESWVEQARILASGGHTEFSKRVDRGEA